MTDSGIVGALRALTPDGGSGRVMLGELKARLGDPDHATFSDKLLTLQDKGVVVLYRENRPAATLSKRDSDAAINVGGYPRHIAILDERAARKAGLL